MKNAIYLVRKHGAVKVNDKLEALELIDLASEQGYNFGYKKQGWSHLVVDLDE